LNRPSENKGRVAILLAHLLKWPYQPEKRSKSWERTIKERRKRIFLLLEESPSLRSEIEKKLSDAYEIAVLSAANETGLDLMKQPFLKVVSIL
jgi:hypothetical protein